MTSAASTHTAFSAAALQAAVDSVYAEHLPLTGGDLASYIPELATADPNQFAVAICTADGQVFTAGDALAEFSAQSVHKPFLYGAALRRHGGDAVSAVVGVEPSGDSFNSLVRLESGTGRPHNPMVNAGAIAIAALLTSRGNSQRITGLLDTFRAFAGRDDLAVDMPVFLSERHTGDRNRAIAHLMRYFGTLAAPVPDALDMYFQACSVSLTTRDLAVMAATLANAGRNPLTKKEALSPRHVRDVLTVMSTCGLYNSSGRFMFDAGLPAKSGVSGGVLAVVPGRLGLAAFSPRLDRCANSVRGVAAVRALSARLGLHMFEAHDHAPAASPSAPADSVALPVAPLPIVISPPSPAASALTTSLEQTIKSVRALYAGAAPVSGQPARYLADLGATDPSHFAVAICAVDGTQAAAGDSEARFSIQAAANPFAYALALKARGPDHVHSMVGVEPSGNPFNAIVLDPDTNRPSNPMGNSGAIAVSAMQPGDDPARRLNGLLSGMAAFAGTKRIAVDAAVLEAEQRTGERNRAIAYLLRNFGVLADVESALGLYFQQCSLSITAPALARMGATLAAGGINPVTGARVIQASLVRPVLSVMYTTGMHDGSGQFAFDVGIPAKSGVSGCIVAVVPGRMGIAVYQPRVDAQGASIMGAAALRHLAATLKLGMFG